MTSVLPCDYCALPVTVRAHDEHSHEAVYCCYGCRFAANVASAKTGDGGLSGIIARLGTAIFLSMNVMVIGLVLYAKSVYPDDGPEAGAEFGDALTALFRYASLLLTTPVLIILGIPILENAIDNLRTRRLTTDLLFALGVSGAYLYSAVSTLRETGHIYFDTACILLILVTFGRWLEAAGKQKTSAAIESIRNLLPDEVTVIRDHQPVTMRSADVRVGDHVLVAAGRHAPVDGVVIEHEGDFDESLVTGEAIPVHKSLGDTVHSGTLSLDGNLVIRATAVGEDATVGKLAKLIRSAQLQKGRFENLADRISAVFIPCVAFAALAAGLWAWRSHGLDSGIMTLLAVVLIACPCALGLATPMAAWSAMGAAARSGVLFRNTEAVEKLASVKNVMFDKTGTLTTGHTVVTSFDTVEANGDSVRDVLSPARGLSEKSHHHVAQAVARYADERGAQAVETVDVTTSAGRGAVGKLLADGRTVAIGNERLMQALGVSIPKTAGDMYTQLIDKRSGASYLAIDDRVVAVIGFSERLRPQAVDATVALKTRGLHVEILTGDHPARAEELAGELGVSVAAGLLPEQKLDRVREVNRESPVAMVGDGLNDAPALAAADVGVAMGCGAEVARDSANVCLADNDLSKLVWAIDLARSTVRTIKQNLFWAFAYNTIGIGLAMTGRLNPIIAAVAMVASNAIVVTNSLRLSRRARSAHAQEEE
jgi:P-type Cu+ transporter